MNLKFLKREEGSITVYVLVALVFILAIIFGRYLLANRQLQTQLSALKQLKNLYESDVREYSNGNTIIVDEPTTGPLPTDQGVGTIPVVIDTSNVIPIYNAEDLLYFVNGNLGPRYIYQLEKLALFNSNKTLRLMHDVKIDEYQSDICVRKSGGYTAEYTFTNEYEMLNNASTFDFNDYCIFSSDGCKIYKSNGRLYVERP